MTDETTTKKLHITVDVDETFTDALTALSARLERDT